MGQLDMPVSYAVRATQDRSSILGDIDVSVSARRALAGFFDTAILGLILVAFLHANGYVSQTWSLGVPMPGRLSFLPHHFVISIFYLRMAPMIVFVGACIAFFTFFEWVFTWTPGKLLFGIRVVNFFGGRPTFLQVLMRNAFRLLDGYPFVIPNLVGSAIMLSNRRHQRGGDKAAGTLVVDRRASSAARAITKIQSRTQAAQAAAAGEGLWV